MGDPEISQGAAARPVSPAATQPYRSPRRDRGAPADGVSLDQLLRAGRDLFEGRGYHNITVDDIRREAGISRATFYFYFRDKRHLLLELMSLQENEFTGLAHRHYPGKDEYSRIVAANAAYLYGMARDAPLLAQILSLALVDDEIRQLYESIRRRFDERVERRLIRLLQEQRIPETNPGLLAAALVGMVETFAVRFFVVDTQTSARHVRFTEALKFLSETWYKAVYGSAAPADFTYEEYQPEGVSRATE